jgi:flagellar assembly protein FliH
MSLWSEHIRFAEPLRAVRLGRASDAPVRAVDPALLQEAFERGRIEGEKGLGEQLVQQRAEMQQLLDGVIGSLRNAVAQVAQDTEQHIVALALEIAQKLVADLPISVEMIEAAVRDALSQVEGTAEFHVRLHPADLALLHSVHSLLLTSTDETRTARFHGSPEVTRGGCLVQTRFGIVDARRETKLDLLKRSLLG